MFQQILEGDFMIKKVILSAFAIAFMANQTYSATPTEDFNACVKKCQEGKGKKCAKKCRKAAKKAAKHA